MTTYTINTNEEFRSIEISFDGKPSEAIRDALKALRMLEQQKAQMAKITATHTRFCKT